MSAQTPGCGSTSDAEKRRRENAGEVHGAETLAAVLEAHAGIDYADETYYCNGCLEGLGRAMGAERRWAEHVAEAIAAARIVQARAGEGALPQPAEKPFRPWCSDCGPGYRLGDEGCRHDNYTPDVGETGICRTCAQPIWWETGEVGHREHLGWSDRIERGGDSLVCFKAVGYRHVPMGARETAIYQAGRRAALDTAGDPT